MNDIDYSPPIPKTLLVKDNKNDFSDITSSLSSLLEHKNRNYGNSALEPLGVFGEKHKLGRRLDEKLQRVKHSDELRKNDVVDIMGYLVLLCRDLGWTNFDDLKD